MDIYKNAINNRKREDCKTFQQHSFNIRSPFLDATHHGDHLLHSYKWKEGLGSSCGLGGELNPLLLKLPAELARKPHPLHSHKLVLPQKGISPTSQFHQDYLAEVKFAFKGQKNCQHQNDFVQLDKHTSIPLEWEAWLQLWKMKRWVRRACEASSDATY